MGHKAFPASNRFGRCSEPAREKASLLVEGVRPATYCDAVGAHLPLALICGAVLLLSCAISIETLPLKACTFVHLTGYPCPFCGFTRAFWAMGHGDWGYALADCPLAIAAYGGVLMTFFWNAVPLAMGLRIRRGRLLRRRPRQMRRAVVFILFLFAVNWAYRLAMGLR